MKTEIEGNRKEKKRKTSNEIYRNLLKRFFDILFSFSLLVILCPIIIIVSILVKLKLGSPVLFKQSRPGINEEIFTMYKLRTMTDEKDEYGDLLPDSKRITKFGKILRSTSLDELPGLINIIKGDMSIVGPRPLLIKYLPFYYEEERARSFVRPGITGLAQINGRNQLEWAERFKLDVKYVNNVSMILDIKIILKSILVVLQRKDILVGTEHVLQDLDVERRENHG